MDSETIVEVRGLNHWFGSGDVRKQALFDVNLTLKRGSFTVLMGPSGSGKTTVLTLVGCLRAVQDGSVRLLESELNGASQAQLVNLRRRLGFTGELRATGDVLIDQLAQMQRSGFSQAVLRDDQNLEHGTKLLAHYPAFYQGDAVDTRPHFAAA